MKCYATIQNLYEFINYLILYYLCTSNEHAPSLIESEKSFLIIMLLLWAIYMYALKFFGGFNLVNV